MSSRESPEMGFDYSKCSGREKSWSQGRHLGSNVIGLC